MAHKVEWRTANSHLQNDWKAFLSQRKLNAQVLSDYFLSLFVLSDLFVRCWFAQIYPQLVEHHLPHQGGWSVQILNRLMSMCKFETGANQSTLVFQYLKFRAQELLL